MQKNNFRLIIVLTISTVVGFVTDGVYAIDPAGMDTSVQPGNDFFSYANGNWVKKTEIPADRSRWGTFSILRDEASKRTADLIQDLAKSSQASGSNSQKVSDYYASFLDQETIEKNGLEPIRASLKEILEIQDKTQLARLLGSMLLADVDPLNNAVLYTENLFGLWTAPGFSDPGQYTAYLLQGGLGMPDREYFLSDNPRMVQLRKAYQAHIVSVLKLGGTAEADSKAARILDLEMRIAQAHLSRTESEDVLKANNPWSRDDFVKKAPGLDWNAFFEGARLTRQPVFIVWQPRAFTGISAAVQDIPLETWKDYLTFHLLNRYSQYLPKAFVNEHFNFHDKTLAGTPQMEERWKTAIDQTNVAVGFAVGELYAKRYFTPQAKKAAEEMVANIRAAFTKRIDALAWMSPQTKAKAKRKVETLYVGIGYPEKWRDYSALKIIRGDALGNWRRAQQFEYNRQISRLGKNVDPTEWAMTPQTVNAVNLPLQNALNFPAAILEKPFFDATADPVVNYGAIGTVIGHEVSHSFDDQGSQFDADGRLINWWTDADRAHFKEQAERLVKQYEAYTPFPDLHVNGHQTLSENIADVAGLSAAFDGWRISLKGNTADKVNGFSEEQAFFIAYAQNWRGKSREEAARQQILTDGHAPGQYRAAAVRNLDPWYEAFTVKAQDALYLAPQNRVRVW